MGAANVAWKYFVNNTNPDTGLVNATHNYPSTTLWDASSFLLGMIAAERLGILERNDFDSRLTKALGSLVRMQLFDGQLPNKAYDVRTLAMALYNNDPTERGLGWSALDVSRVLVPLEAINRLYPEHAAEVAAVIGRWDLPALTRNGELTGTIVNDAGATVLVQEGRLGYEQYGAKSLLTIGLDAFQSAKTERYLQFKDVEGIPVPVDTRMVANSSPAFITSEPYMLDGLEYGFDTVSHALASNVYSAQQKRFENTGILTAVTEGHMNQKPYFGYSTVWGNGSAWAVTTLTGERIDSLRYVSTKAAFAFDALFATDYTAQLVASLMDLADPEKGWPEGRYEIDGAINTSTTANTNGIVLESLAYKKFGPLNAALLGGSAISATVPTK